MDTTNDVFQVLVVNGDPEAGTAPVLGMTDGDWGVFDAETDLAIDLTASPVVLPSKFYFAINKDGKILKSAGNFISKKGAKYTNISDRASTVNGVITVTPDNNLVDVDSTYSLHIEFRGNSELAVTYGKNAATKFFIGDTGCNPTNPESELLAQLYEAIANDEDHFMNVEITGVAGVATYNTATQEVGELSGAQKTALATLRATAHTNEALVITVKPLSSMYSYCNINPKYFELRSVQPIATFGDSSCAWGTIVETTPMVFGKNFGYDIRELEYQAMGWNDNISGTYRQSGLHGLPLGNYTYLAAADTTQYNIFTFQYEMLSEAGWSEYKNSASVIVATTEIHNASTPTSYDHLKGVYDAFKLLV